MFQNLYLILKSFQQTKKLPSLLTEIRGELEDPANSSILKLLPMI